MEKQHRLCFISVLFIISITFLSCKKKNEKKSEVISEELIKDISYEKNVVDSICDEKQYVFCEKYTDSEGVKHIAVKQIQTKSEVYDAIEEESFNYTSVQLLVKFFLNGNEFVKVFDEETSCNGDSEAKIIENSIKITDIDNNGVKEVSFLYDLVCMENTYPSDMKFIMIEGNKKYKIRGAKHFFDNKMSHTDLAFNIDGSFENASKKFLDYATTVWNDNLYDSKTGKITNERKKNMGACKSEIIKSKEKFIIDNNLK